MDLLLKNGLILEGENFKEKNKDILIKGNKIISIEDNIKNKNAKTIDLKDKLVIPGLVNAHLHSDENMFKGALDNLPLELWMLYSYPNAKYGPFSPRLIYLRTLLGAIEMVKNGVTHAQDDVSEFPKPTMDGMDAVMNAYKDIGLRASVTTNLSDKDWMGKLPYISNTLPANLKEKFKPAGTKEELFEYAKNIIDKWHDPEGRLHFVIAPSGPQRCTDEFLKMLSELSEEKELPIHTHILETKMQAVTGDEFYGQSIIKHLNELGVLSDKTTIIHSVWVDDEDIKIMGDKGVSVVHNPVSNLKLGSGIMPFRKLVDSGVNIAIGSDGMSSNDTQNIFEGMKFAALLHKINDPDYHKWPSSKEVFKMATLGGAKSSLTDDELGTIEVGKKADLAVLDLNTTAFLPQNDILKHLVYCENGSSVETVIVDGEIIVRDGEILTIDEEAILAEFKKMVPKFKEQYQKTVELSDELFPYVDDIYWKCVKQDVGVNRWAGNENKWLE